MNFEIVRRKCASLRQSLPSSVSWVLLLSLFVGLPAQVAVSPSANALYFGTGYTAAPAGNAGGGSQNGNNVCATDKVAVGVGFTVNGSNPGFGVYCRSIGADGQLVDQDQSSASNTTAVGGGNTKVFCGPGQVVTGFSFVVWSNVRIRCATPPSLNDDAQTGWGITYTSGTEQFSNCATGIVAGFYTRTGAWTDAIGAYCLPYSLNTLSYNVNGGSGSAPSSQTQTQPVQALTIATYSGTRTGFHLSGWNTQADGLGTDYSPGSSITPVGAVTLYAKWISYISYNGNTNTSGSTPSQTTAVSSAASTILAQNSGTLAKTGYTFSGWNTLSTGLGTNYPASTPSIITETPYMHFDAADFVDSRTAWADTSGNSRSIPGTAVTSASAGAIRGNPIKVTNSAGTNGSSKSFPAVQGGTADGIVIGNGALTNYTFCHVARYAGANRNRIFAGTAGNWLSGFWSSATGVAYHEGWITPSTGTNDTNWKIQCDTGGTSSLLRTNGVLKSSVSNSSVGLPANISINLQGSRSAPTSTDLSDWAVAEFYIFDSVLSDTKIQELEANLNIKYGITGFISTRHSFYYGSTGDTTLYAQWNSTITYDGNNKTSGTVPAPTTIVGNGGSATLATNSGSLARTNYTFAGWNTAADGTGTGYAAGASSGSITGATTLYAYWLTTAGTPTLVATSDSGSSNSDNITNDSTPELSVSNLTIGATVTITAYNPATTAVGTCSFVATSTTQTCSISTALTSNSYYFMSSQSFGGVTTTNSTRSSPVVQVDTVAPVAYVTTVGTNTSISWKNTQTGQVSSDSLGTVYLVRNSVTVSNASSITSADSTLWKSVTITQANVATNVALTGLLGGTYKAYALDVAGNFGSVSTSSMLIYSQANAPTGLIATPGVGTMGPKFDLTWTAPTNDGGGISSYLVEYSTDGGSTWVSYPRNASPGTTYSVYPVSYETDYLFRISAVNLWGTGTTSSNSDVKKVAITSCSPTSSPNGATFIFPIGVCSWTVPSGVTSVNVDARGGQGGIGIYGFAWGGRITGTLTVTPGETLLFYVGDEGGDYGDIANGYTGRGGFNGGGFGGTVTASIGTTGSGGGGATDIRTTTNDLSTRVVVAGGGGGSSNRQGNSCCRSIGQGASGGGLTGGSNSYSDGSSGGGGTQSAGGYSYGSSASAGLGGTGQNQSTDNGSGGGGGGGGYYGGGGGGGAWSTGGGGGSSYIGNSRFTSTANSQGVNCAPGFLAITIGSDLSQVPPVPANCTTTRDVTPPVISTQTVSSDGLSITLTYTDVSFMSTSFIPRNLFSVVSGGSNISVSSISATGKTLTLTLAQNIRPGAVTTISYTDPSSGNDVYAAQDEFGNDAASFSNRTITTTSITVATPTTPVLAAASDTGSSNSDKNTSDNTPTFSAGSLVIGATVTFTATPSSGSAVTCIITATATTDSCTFTTLPDSTYSVSVKQASGTVTSGSPAALTGVVIVTAGPTVAITNNVLTNNGTTTSTSATTFTITFSASVTGFTASGLTKTGSNWTLGTLSGSGTTYTITATSNGNSGSEGVITLKVNAGAGTDTYGNTSSASSTFTGNWTSTVTYNANGGSAVPKASDVQTSSSSAITLPAVGTMTKTGNSFGGWSTTSNGTSVGTTYTPTANVTLYAVWIPSVFVVSFDANGGTGSVDSATVNYTYGTSGLAITSTYNSGTLSKTGYSFAGWSTTNNGAAVANPYVPTASVTLFARWTPGTFAITFDSNTATSGTLANQNITAGTAATLSANAYSKTGFTFNGWNTAANGSGIAYAAGASVTLYGNTRIYAQWKPLAPGAPSVSSATAGNTTVVVTVAAATISGTAGAVDSFTVVTYDNAGSVVAGKGCTILASSNPLSCTITGLTNGTIYKFKTTAFNATGSAVSAAFSSTATPAPYTVIYNINGGTSGSITNGSYDLGTALTLPTPSRTSYTFAGWYDTTTAGNLIGVAGASYSPSGNITLYARWTGVAYTINYYANSATSGTVPSPGSFTTGGTAATISGNTGSLARTGYTFAGWDTSTAGNGTSYAVNASYSSNANLNLYAKWSPVARTVTYAGTTTSGSLPAQLLNKYIGDSFTVSSASGFARTGYAFSGWNDGTNLYAAGSTYTLSSSDVTLTAQWTGLSYSVTYLANGGSGSLPTQINLSSGETFTVQTNTLTKTGYSFVAWNDGTSNYAPGATYTMSSANTSLIAQWTATGYTISYNGNGSNGGSAPTTGHYVTGGAPYSVALNSFSRTGYNFSGWTTNSDGSGTAYAAGAGYAATADLTLYAQWAAKTIAISYNLNGGSGTIPGSQNWTYSESSTATLDAGSGLTKTGYTFGGWAASASASTGASTGAPSASITFYAVWTPVSYSVTYSAGSGSGTVPTETGKTLGSTFTLAAGSGLTPPSPSAGVTYSFAYWSDGTSNYAPGATYLMPSNNVLLTAQWVAIYNVTYNANGGTTSNPSEQKTDGAALTIGSAPTRTGYTFGKWIDQSGGQWDPAATTTVTANRYIFTASWTANLHSVTYSLNGGSGSTPTTLTGKTIGQIVTLDSTTATKSGYTFGGWSIGGVTYPVGGSYTIADADIVPTAVWNAATYSITYNGNGATSGTNPTGGTFTTGGSYTAASNTGILAKTGFTFAGWNTAVNGSGTSYAEGATTVSTAADLILYAKWTAASYSVTYVLNGATSALPTQSDVQFGSTFTIAAAATQAGKTFTGWTDNTNTYGGGSSYTMGGAPVTLTATWANQLFAITYSLNGGTGATPTQVSLSFTDSFTVQSNSATKAGYSFGGWSNGSNTYQANSTYNMTTSNVTLTAIWNIAAPGTPGTPTVVAGDGNATITVVAPSSGGAPTSYTVTASPGGSTCTVISPATSCTIAGLANGTSYSFSTVANNSTGSSSGSASSASVSPAGKPGVPTGVSATIGNGTATVSLTPPTNTGGPAITSYTMTASPGGASCTVNAPATSCVISSLTNGTAYTFTATAFNGVAQSDSSTASASATPATVPGAPTITSTSSSSSGSATVNFSAPASTGGSAITGYTITSNPGGITCSAAANATSCAVSGLTDGIAYTFTAVATNAIGNSTSSTPSGSVTSAGAPSAPTSVTATVADGSSVVSVSGANANGSAITGYTIQAYDATGAALTGKTCTITAPATSCTVSGLTNGSDYTFKAVTTNAVGSSPASSPSAQVTPAGVPSAPTGVSVTSGTGKVTVAWTAPSANGSAITSYTAQAYDADGNAVSGATCTISAPATSCDVSTNLSAGNNYTFKVSATNAAGSGAHSSASSAAAINSASSAPLNVTATSANSAAVVSWDAPAENRGSAVTSYTVSAYTSGNVLAGTCNTSSPTTTCSVTGLTNGDAYTFKVSATNGIGTSLQSSASAPITPSTVPGVPTGVVASAGDGSASISFIAPTNNGGASISSYTVTASNGTTVTGTSSPITVSGLSNNTAYTFTVRATNVNGNSNASSSSSAATPSASIPPTQSSDAQPSGNPYVGSTLTSQVEFSGSPVPTQAYQWQVCTSDTDPNSCTDISGATSATFIPSIAQQGNYIRVEVTATNTLGSNVVTSNPTLVINPEIIFIAPSSGLTGTANSSFVLSVAASGGIGSFSYTVSSGALPAGISLDPTTGQLSGTPTSAGSYTFTVRATDSNGVTKNVSITITIAAATSSGSGGGGSSSPVPAAPAASAATCDSACQAANAARIAADKAAADALAKAKADAAAKAAADKAAADAAAAAAANRAQTSAQSKAAADAAAAVQAAADAAAKAAAAAAAKTAADKAAAEAAAAVKAAATAASSSKNGSGATASAANAIAAKAAADAAAAVKAAADAAAAAVAAKKQVDISLNLSISASAQAANSAAAQKQANAVAAAAKAAADAAAAKATSDAAAAKAAATAAANAALSAKTAAVAEQAAAVKAAADAKIAADNAAKAVAAKAAADAAAQKVANDLAAALATKAAQSAVLATVTDPTAKASAELALAAASKAVEQIQVTAQTVTANAELKATAAIAAQESANNALQVAQDKSESAAQATATVAAKAAEASKAASTVTATAAAAKAAQAIAKSIPATAKDIPTSAGISKSGNGTVATITGLKPGQKIKVTVKVK